MLPEDWASIPFTKSDGDYTLNSSITLPKAQLNAMTETDIEDLKQEIFDSWKANLIALED